MKLQSFEYKSQLPGVVVHFSTKIFDCLSYVLQNKIIILNPMFSNDDSKYCTPTKQKISNIYKRFKIDWNVLNSLRKNSISLGGNLISTAL